MRLSATNVEEFVKSVFNKQPEKEFAETNIDFLATYWRCMLEAGPGVAYGVEEGGKPVGFLLASHCVDPMTGLKKAFEYFWFVTPEFRGTKKGLQLLKEFESGAKEAGCVDTILGCNVVYKPEALGRLYTRRGYEPIAQSYRKRL